MPVSRYKFKIPKDDGFLKIPLDMTFQLVDQSETIEKDFVKPELDKAVNEIKDYEKVRFTPIGITPGIINVAKTVTYKLFFYDTQNTTFQIPTTYSDIGFDNDDLKFRKNSLIKSSLILNFYDTDILTNQRLVSRIVIHPNIDLSDTTTGNVNSASVKEVVFSLANPLSYLQVVGGGFFIYHYKDEVDINLPKSLYMRATFNNAKTGKSTNFMTNTTITTIDNLVGKLHTKYDLIRLPTGFFYSLDDTYPNNQSNNVQVIPNPPFDIDCVINLYELVVS